MDISVLTLLVQSLAAQNCTKLYFHFTFVASLVMWVFKIKFHLVIIYDFLLSLRA